MTDRTCPCCERDHLLSPAEAEAVFNTSTWGADALLSSAVEVCSWCRYVRLEDGTVDRLQSVGERAYRLSQAGTKSKSEYRDRLGELPTPDSDEPGGAVKPTDKEW